MVLSVLAIIGTVESIVWTKFLWAKFISPRRGALASEEAAGDDEGQGVVSGGEK